MLDWGAGHGHFSYYLLHSGCSDVTSFVTTPVGEGCFFRTACKRFTDRNYRFIRQPEDPVVLPFSDASFAAVSSIAVLEHVRETGGNEIGSLREIERILEPGGLFICYHLPSKSSLIESISDRLGMHEHNYKYNKKDILKLMETTDFSILEMGKYGMVPRNITCYLKIMRANIWAANVYNLLDVCLSFLLRPLSQNYYFVARKNT